MLDATDSSTRRTIMLYYILLLYYYYIIYYHTIILYIFIFLLFGFHFCGLRTAELWRYTKTECFGCCVQSVAYWDYLMPLSKTSMHLLPRSTGFGGSYSVCNSAQHGKNAL